MDYLKTSLLQYALGLLLSRNLRIWWHFCNLFRVISDFAFFKNRILVFGVLCLCLGYAVCVCSLFIYININIWQQKDFLGLRVRDRVSCEDRQNRLSLVLVEWAVATAIRRWSIRMSSDVTIYSILTKIPKCKIWSDMQSEYLTCDNP